MSRRSSKSRTCLTYHVFPSLGYLADPHQIIATFQSIKAGSIPWEEREKWDWAVVVLRFKPIVWSAMTANVTFTVVVHIDVQAHLSSHSTEVKLDGWFELQTHSSMVRNTSIASSRKPHLIDGFCPSLKSKGCVRERGRERVPIVPPTCKWQKKPKNTKRASIKGGTSSEQEESYRASGGDLPMLLLTRPGLKLGDEMPRLR